jgi:hypothetical protein
MIKTEISAFGGGLAAVVASVSLQEVHSVLSVVSLGMGCVAAGVATGFTVWKWRRAVRVAGEVAVDGVVGAGGAEVGTMGIIGNIGHIGRIGRISPIAGAAEAAPVDATQTGWPMSPAARESVLHSEAEATQTGGPVPRSEAGRGL